ENAGRALLIPRAYPGKRTPLWQQRLKSQSLLEVAKQYADFPIILETYRECLRDVLDVPGLQALLGALHTRELSLVEVETKTASPISRSTRSARASCPSSTTKAWRRPWSTSGAP